MPAPPPDPIERELIHAQRAYRQSRAAATRRRDAVMRAWNTLGPDGARVWTDWRIAKALHVDPSTVRAIIAAAERNATKQPPA